MLNIAHNINTLKLFNIIYLIIGAMLLSNISHAKPDLTTPVDLSILHRHDTGYKFISQTFSLAKPNMIGNERLQNLAKPRHYKVWLAIPNNATDSVRPVLYLLDGNAALADTDAKTLHTLAKAQAPILVFIGYDTPWRFDTQARAFDYTPPLDNHFVQDETALRLNGGAQLFGQFLQHRLKPWVVAEVTKQNIQLDESKQILWGHSYGGLFALFSLFYQPSSFSQYDISDPSLWWQGQHVVKLMQAKLPLNEYVAKQPKQYVSVNFTFSGSIKHHKSRAEANKTKQDFIRQVCEIKQIHCEHKFYKNHNHGQLFKTSLSDSYQQFLNKSKK